MPPTCGVDTRACGMGARGVALALAAGQRHREERGHGELDHRRAVHGDVQLHAAVSVHQLQPGGAADRRRLQGRRRTADRQGREGRREARRTLVHRDDALARRDDRRQHHRGPDRRRSRHRAAGRGDRRDRHRRGRRADGRARSAGRQDRRHREAPDPVPGRRHDAIGQGGRTDRPGLRRCGRRGAPRRADRDRATPRTRSPIRWRWRGRRAAASTSSGSTGRTRPERATATSRRSRGRLSAGAKPPRAAVPITELETRVLLGDGTVVLDGPAVGHTMPIR